MRTLYSRAAPSIFRNWRGSQSARLRHLYNLWIVVGTWYEERHYIVALTCQYGKDSQYEPMKASLQYPMPEERQRRVQNALFRGAQLSLENSAYLRVLRSLLDALLVPDLARAI